MKPIQIGLVQSTTMKNNAAHKTEAMKLYMLAVKYFFLLDYEHIEGELFTVQQIYLNQVGHTEGIRLLAIQQLSMLYKAHNVLQQNPTDIINSYKS